MCSGAGAVFGAVNQATLRQLEESINQAVAVVRPSVVSIKAQKKKADGGGQGFIWYESIGSGFFIDERGFVLTNYHVAEGAENITVTLWRSQQNNFSARVVHEDQSLDLMVLKIDGNERFIPATLGDSDQVETGDWGISVGSPFGFEHSASLGIVSDLHRELLIGQTSYKDMMQTDAVINEGNSGGPFINIRGQVIGIATAIYAPAGTYTGLGFAIPINRAKHFFSHVTGVVTAALTTPAGPAGNKEPVNLNKKMPNDAIHKKFVDCTQCHTITQKLVINQNTTMTHPMVGACDTCHITVKGNATKSPVTVAATVPLGTQPVSPRGFGGLFEGDFFKLSLVTLIASIVFTMLGVGGGFLYVPILLSCGIDFQTAATTSLLMLATAQISALYIFFKSGLVDFKLVLMLELPTMLGAFAGGLFSDHFNAALLAIMFSCCLFLSSYFMLQEDMQLAASGPNISVSPWKWYREFGGHTYSVDMMVAFPLAFAVGFTGGLLGLGGGWLKIPMMVVLFGIPMKIAVAASTLMVPITGIAGFLGHSVSGHFDANLTLPLCILAVVGAQIGARLSVRAESNLLRFVFAFVLGVVGLWMLTRVF